MPVSGPKPKPRDQIRHRVKPAHDWREVVNTPYAGPIPELPAQPRGSDGPPPPKPSRKLGRTGSAMWRRTWRTAGTVAIDAEALLVLCEQMDERVELRETVMETGRMRTALRQLDQQVAAGLNSLGLGAARAIPAEWPEETLRWWDVVSHMPHCVLWTDADWRFAVDTALITATFHSGDVRVAAELRHRERIMGTTADALRDLRIRYVDDVPEVANRAAVAVMDDYRRIAAAGQAPAEQ
jgi:hypothetical protein